jgi:hypothetical protein
MYFEESKLHERKKKTTNNYHETFDLRHSSYTYIHTHTLEDVIKQTIVAAEMSVYGCFGEI